MCVREKEREKEREKGEKVVAWGEEGARGRTFCAPTESERYESELERHLTEDHASAAKINSSPFFAFKRPTSS